jgi:hypothetical protein
MAAEVSITPASGSVIATLSACRIEVTGADVNNEDGTQKRYRFRLTPPAGLEEETVSGYSELFNVNNDGEHAWNGYIFPGAGAWTVRLYDEEEEEDVDTLAVTVTAP